MSRFVCVPEEEDVCECSWLVSQCLCKRGDDGRCIKCGAAMQEEPK